MGPRNAAESSEGTGQAGISHDGVPLFRAISIWVISLEKWLQEHLEDVQRLRLTCSRCLPLTTTHGSALGWRYCCTSLSRYVTACDWHRLSYIACRDEICEVAFSAILYHSLLLM